MPQLKAFGMMISNLVYLSLVNVGWTFLCVPIRRSQILGSAAGSILLWWNPSLMSALAVGWLHVQADSLADIIKCYWLFFTGSIFQPALPPRWFFCPGGTSIFNQTGQAQENSQNGPLWGLLPREKDHKDSFQEAEQLVSLNNQLFTENANFECQEVRAISEHWSVMLWTAWASWQTSNDRII